MVFRGIHGEILVMVILVYVTSLDIGDFNKDVSWTLMIIHTQIE